MKFVEDNSSESTLDGVLLSTVPPGEIFQWNRKFWMQVIDTRHEDLRVTRDVENHDSKCVGVCLENGRIMWINGDVLVIPINARIRILGRADKKRGELYVEENARAVDSDFWTGKGF